MREERLDEPETGFTPGEHPVFATATMADLLEQPGDAAGAERIRSALARPASTEATSVPEEPAPVEVTADSSEHPESEAAEPREEAPETAAAQAGAEAEAMDAAEAPGSEAVALEAVQPEVPAAGGGEEISARRARIISTLEGWLENIRRGVA